MNTKQLKNLHLEARVFEQCKTDFIKELVNNGYEPNQAKKYADEFGVPYAMLKMYVHINRQR
jgi:hypothetical protein